MAAATEDPAEDVEMTEPPMTGELAALMAIDPPQTPAPAPSASHSSTQTPRPVEGQEQQRQEQEQPAPAPPQAELPAPVGILPLLRAGEGSAREDPAVVKSLGRLLSSGECIRADITTLAEAEELWGLVDARGVHDVAVTVLANTLLQMEASRNADPFALAVVLLDPALQDPDTHDAVVGRALAAVARLPAPAKEAFVSLAAGLSAEQLSAMVGLVQMYITCRLIGTMRVDQWVCWATQALGVLYAANLRSERVSYTLFQNDAVNSFVNFEEDYQLWQSGTAQASTAFCNHPFILNPAAKSEVLLADARAQMNTQARTAIIQQLFGGSSSPYLHITVRRSDLVRDTVGQLMLRASGPEGSLKKPLRVKFHGEDGIDAGGVKKEFFQLVVKALFSPEFGMFRVVESQGWCYWFAASAFLDCDREYELLGMVLGLAIYNGVILDIRFPLVVYKKLQGAEVGLGDLADIDPAAAKGLADLLAFDGDVEGTYCRNFEASYESFGAVVSTPLCEGGELRPVTKENRAEFVRLYVDFFLNLHIEKQFASFRRGFERVCGGFAMKLFRPEELELLVSGSPNYDFVALEKSTAYDAGFTAESPVIVWFWEIVHGWDDAKKKKMLAFATGSDRVPIRGLEDLRLVIQRNGPDSDKLPSAHTCFNVLLLPEYTSKDKLSRLLDLALEHDHGFGLI